MMDDVINLAGIIGIWIFIFAIGFRDRKTDSPKLLLAKRLMRHTFTVTLVLVVLMALWALYFTRWMR